MHFQYLLPKFLSVVSRENVLSTTSLTPLHPQSLERESFDRGTTERLLSLESLQVEHGVLTIVTCRHLHVHVYS